MSSDELSRLVRQRHHLTVARRLLDQAIAGCIVAAPIYLVGLITDDGLLRAVGAILAGASIGCSQLSIRHCNAAKKLNR